MNKSTIHIFLASLGTVLLLSGCQEDTSVAPPAPQERQAQNEVIEKCLSLNDTEPDEKWAYLIEQFNDVDQDGWHPVGYIDEDQNVSRGLSLWKSDELKRVVLENATPSGDWFRIDEYCFNKDGNIARLYSDLRTFYGDVQVMRTWEYYSDGSIKSSNTELIDLKTDESIDPDEANYMDNPPYSAKNYEELIEFLDLSIAD